MKRRYALHPMEFAIGETEQFYSEMAAKGWFLEKRGGWFSRFRCRGDLWSPAVFRALCALHVTLVDVLACPASGG